MRFRQIYFLILFCSFFIALAQKRDSVEKDSIKLGDYIFLRENEYLPLEEVFILKKLHFRSYKDEFYYGWFKKKVLKAYPYAKMACERVIIIDKRLERIKDKRQRKKYIRILQDYLENKFTDQLKKLTRTEGRILIKLMHRNTGVILYDLIKRYKSSWSAFWYNVTAKFFKLSLKFPYDPVHVMEDHMIEDILQRAWRDGTIELLDAKLDFDFSKLPKRDFIYPEKI